MVSYATKAFPGEPRLGCRNRETFFYDDFEYISKQMDYTRRTFLKGAGTAAAVGSLSGCIGEADDSVDASNQQSNIDPAIVRFASNAGACASSDEENVSNIKHESYEDEPDEVHFSGRLVTPSPCYEPKATAIAQEVPAGEETRTIVRIVITAEPTDEQSDCETCEGVIPFSGTAEVSGGRPSDAVIELQDVKEMP